MISRLFGLIDLIAAVFLLLAGFEIMFTGFFIVILLLLLGKSLIFIKNWASWVDIIVVVLMLLVMFNIYTFINIIAILWLLQKGVVSIFT